MLKDMNTLGWHTFATSQDLINDPNPQPVEEYEKSKVKPPTKYPPPKRPAPAGPAASAAPVTPPMATVPEEAGPTLPTELPDGAPDINKVKLERLPRQVVKLIDPAIPLRMGGRFSLRSLLPSYRSEDRQGDLPLFLEGGIQPTGYLRARCSQR